MDFPADFFDGPRKASLSPAEMEDGRSHLRDFMATHASHAEAHPAVAVLRAAAAVSLTRDEHAGIGERLRSYIRFMPAERTDGMIEEDAFDGFYDQISLTLASLSLRKLPAIAAAFLVLGFGGMTVTQAADNALPGDMFYAFKIHVIEHPYINFHFATAAKADWQTELAERRLDEAERLAAEGRLTDEARAALSAQYDRHSQRVKSYKGNGLQHDFETSMQGREAVLRGLVEERGEADIQLRVLLDRLQHAKRDTQPVPAAASSAPAVNNESTQDEARRQLDAAHRRVEQVRIYFESIEDDVSDAAMGNAQQRLTQATTTLAQAHATFDGGNVAEAANLAKRASLLAQEAKLLARADAELKVDLTRTIRGE